MSDHKDLLEGKGETANSVPPELHGLMIIAIHCGQTLFCCKRTAMGLVHHGNEFLHGLADILVDLLPAICCLKLLHALEKLGDKFRADRREPFRKNNSQAHNRIITVLPGVFFWRGTNSTQLGSARSGTLGSKDKHALSHR